MRYAFLSKSRHQKLNPQWKNLGSVALERGHLILANCGFKGLIFSCGDKIPKHHHHNWNL
jgi:hypothetical protein